MPVIVDHPMGDVEDSLHVLITGFGPFNNYYENPSWLAVKQLHNTILYADSPTEPISIHEHAIIVEPLRESRRRPVHVTTLKIPVTYEAVLSTVPGLHAHPPRFPPPTGETLSPPPSLPKQGYDFIFHLGVAGRGPLRMERLGHKFGYHMKDATQKLAPIVLPAEFSGKGMVEPSEAERQERERLAASSNAMEIAGDSLTPTRGFGEGYREFTEEMYTDIDVEKLVHDLKRSGIEEIYTSMDAGHYICDFIYYCSLAEAKRTATRKGKGSKVLFLHCPPVGQPLTSEEVAEAIKRVIVWVCGTIPDSEPQSAPIAQVQLSSTAMQY